MGDYMLRATAADGSIRAFAITSKDTVEKARLAHNLSPIATAALGRTMSAALMMGYMLKGDKDTVSIHIEGSGPMKGINVQADAKGCVKGYVFEPDVELPPNSQGKLDVGNAIGIGVLTVIKDMGLKDPYVGQTELKTGEIAEDLTYYFAVSEQVPSSVGLGVLVDVDCSVRQAGGFILQLMPDVSDEVIDKLEEKIKGIKSVTEMFEDNMTPEDIINELLGDFNVEILDKHDVEFKCDCSEERVLKAVAGLNKNDLQSLIDEGEPLEIRCQYCNKVYNFSIDKLKELM